MLEQVLQHLAAAGPLAMVLGVAVWKLWEANGKERDRHAAQEDAMREAHEQERRDEAERHAKAVEAARTELTDLYRKLTRAVRDEDSHER